MPTFLDALTNITPGISGSWQSVDVSAHCPAGTTGIIAKVVKTGYAAEALGWRKNGSTDDRRTSVDNVNTNVQLWFACGVDTNRILNLYVGANIAVYLVGYFGAEAVFFTDAINKSFASLGSWETVDIAGDVNPGDTAIMAFLDVRGLANHTFGLRKPGSTDNIKPSDNGARGAVVGLDANNQFECYIQNAANDIYLNGYLKAGATIDTNLTDITPVSTGSFVDLAALPAGAIGGIYEVWTSTASYPLGIRCNGHLETTFGSCSKDVWAMTKCDASRLVEAKIANITYNRVYLHGYFTNLPTPAITNLSSSSGYVGDSVTITGTGFNASQGTGSVTFNGTAATITSWSDISIVCTVPAGATTGNIVVTNLWGNASTGTAYTVKSLPTGASSTPETPIHTGNPVGAGPNVGLSPVR